MKKMSHLLAATALILSSAATVAHAHDARNMTGFYAGGNFGYGMGTAKGNWNSTGTNIQPGESVNTNNDLGLKGVRGGFMLGYGKVFQNKLYAGLELGADYSNTEGKLDQTYLQTQNFNLKTKRRDAYSASVRLGAMLNSMLTYIKLGVETAKWKTEASTTSYINFANGGISDGKVNAASKNQRLTGFIFGLGMETMVSDHLVLGGEWSYTQYRGSSTIQVTQAGIKNAGVNFNVKPRTNDFRLRLAYKW